MRPNPAARFVNTTTMPPTMPAAPAGGFPQTPPSAPASSRTSIDDTLVTPSAHMASAIVGCDFEPELHDRGRLRRPLRPRHAGPPRPRDAAQPGRSRVGDGLLHRGADASFERRRLRASPPARRRGAYGRPPDVAYWENIFPGAAGGGITRHAGDHRAFIQNGPDWITALYDMDTSLLAGLQHVRPVRVLRRTVRFARGDQLARPRPTTTA